MFDFKDSVHSHLQQYICFFFLSALYNGVTITWSTWRSCACALLFIEAFGGIEIHCVHIMDFFAFNRNCSACLCIANGCTVLVIAVLVKSVCWRSIFLSEGEGACESKTINPCTTCLSWETTKWGRSFGCGCKYWGSYGTIKTKRLKDRKHRL